MPLSSKHIIKAILFLLSTISVLATPCVVFDNQFNLYAFGAQGRNDWNFGKQEGWSRGPDVTIPSQLSRPPFDGVNTQCFLAQFQNSIYVINGDNANPQNIHIYNAMTNSWSIQLTDVSAGVKLDSSGIVLDHDTNVFFAMSEGILYELGMAELTAATPVPLVWQLVKLPNFNTQNYIPLMGVANNHIHFLNVPGSSAGQANIFVIHFAFFQPEVQLFPPAQGAGNAFPAQHGQITSLFAPTEAVVAQSQFAFIPADTSATYVINAMVNSTTTLPAPPSAKPAYYAGSTSALVTLSPNGQLFYLPFTGTTTSISTGSTNWTAILNPRWTPDGGVTSTITSSSLTPETSGPSFVSASVSAVVPKQSTVQTSTSINGSTPRMRGIPGICGVIGGLMAALVIFF